jgi:predicted dehydrogenase
MTLRLIQAGVGGMGRAWWKNAILNNTAGVELVAIADPAAGPRDECGDAFGLAGDRRFADLAEALDAVDADAVLTVTPPAVHLPHAEIVFSRGLHLLTEKPIGNTLNEAKRMVALADAAGRQLVVAQNYRYSAAAQTLIRLAREKPLGEIGHAHIDFYIPGDFRGSFRQTMPYPLLIDMAIHHIDLVRAVLGRDIAKVTAHTFRPGWSWYDHHPGLHMMMQLDGGTPVSYSGDWSARGRSTGWNGAWRLQCENGSIELLHDGKIQTTTSTFWGNDAVTVDVPPDETPLTGQSALLHRFAAAVTANAPAETSGRDNLKSFAAVQAGVLSAEQGRTVAVAELLE